MKNSVTHDRTRSRRHSAWFPHLGHVLLPLGPRSSTVRLPNPMMKKNIRSPLLRYRERVAMNSKVREKISSLSQSMVATWKLFGSGTSCLSGDAIEANNSC
jgi:hypothetical protein